MKIIRERLSSGIANKPSKPKFPSQYLLFIKRLSDRWYNDINQLNLRKRSKSIEIRSIANVMSTKINVIVLTKIGNNSYQKMGPGLFFCLALYRYDQQYDLF